MTKNLGWCVGVYVCAERGKPDFALTPTGSISSTITIKITCILQVCT